MNTLRRSPLGTLREQLDVLVVAVLVLPLSSLHLGTTNLEGRRFTLALLILHQLRLDNRSNNTAQVLEHEKTRERFSG